MMIHEKLMSGQFLLDFKNDHAVNLLHVHPHATHHALHALHPQMQHQHLHQHSRHHQHHQHHHHHNQPQPQQQQQQQQLPSPPMPAGAKMDLYSAYAYQQHLQQQLLGSASATATATANARSPLQPDNASVLEVLDLSRRCDSIETPPRKTPSPYQSTASSFGTGSPVHSPPQQPSVVPANLLYSSVQPHSSAASALALPPASLAALYPALYYPGSMTAVHIKPEASSAMSITPPLTHPTATVPQTRSSSADILPTATTNTLLQTFASAAAVAAAASATAINHKMDNGSDVAPASPVSGTGSNTKPTAMATTPTSSTSASAVALATLDGKATRPFKAFPRDPLVIAANFAATDVLLDNPRVERYTEYRKRVLEQIRSSNGGSRTVTNPKMRRTNSRSGSINDGCSSSNNNSENDERSLAAEESSDCDSNAGNFDKLTSTSNNNSNNNNNTSSSSEANATNSGTGANNTSTAATSAMFAGGLSQVKDAAYYERRRKNNAAAKKSRDRRRIKEDEIAIRAAYLERQNIELLCQIDSLKAQLASFTSKVGA